MLFPRWSATAACGILNLVGQNRTADIVTVVAGGVATILAMVQFGLAAAGVLAPNAHDV